MEFLQNLVSIDLPTIATLAFAVLGIIFGTSWKVKFSKVMKEGGELIFAVTDLIKTIVSIPDDNKMTQGELAALKEKAKAVDREFKDVINLFKKKAK